MIYITNTHSDTSRAAALRLTHTSVKKRLYGGGVEGEVIHVEAHGSMYINPGPMDGESVAETIDRVAANGKPDAFPISLHFEVPPADAFVPRLGDIITVAIRRGDEYDYAVSGASFTATSGATLTTSS